MRWLSGEFIELPSRVPRVGSRTPNDIRRDTHYANRFILQNEQFANDPDSRIAAIGRQGIIFWKGRIVWLKKEMSRLRGSKKERRTGGTRCRMN